MRRILPALLLIVFLLAAREGYAQSPPGINYQGIARNTDGKPLAQKNIAIRINIVEHSDNGNVEYAEVHSVKTNAFGLFTLVIGSGAVEVGSFNMIAWGAGDKWLRVEMDPDGGNSFQLMGSQQFMSVPYAFYARFTGTPLTAGEGISIVNNVISSTTPQSTADKDEQQLSISSDELSISGGNKVDLSPYRQDLHIVSAGNTRTLTIDNGVGVGFTVDDDDHDPVNELQQLSYNAATRTVSISGATGNSVVIPESQTLNNVLSQGSDANGQRISNLGTPTSGTDAVTKQYVDATDAAITTRINSNYAFKATYTFSTVLAVSEVTMPLAKSFDDFNVLGATFFTAPTAGTYVFVLDGSSTGLLLSSAITLSYSGAKYPVTVGTNNRFNSTFMFRLTAGQTVSVVATGLGVSTSINGSFFGYKLL